MDWALPNLDLDLDWTLPNLDLDLDWELPNLDLDLDWALQNGQSAVLSISCKTRQVYKKNLGETKEEKKSKKSKIKTSQHAQLLISASNNCRAGKVHLNHQHRSLL